MRCKWGSSNSVRWLTHYLQDTSLFLMQIFFWACVCSDRYSFYSVMVIFPYLCRRFFSWHRFLEVRSICRGFVDNTSCSWVFWLSLLEHPPGRMCCGYFAHCGIPAISFNEIRFLKNGLISSCRKYKMLLVKVSLLSMNVNVIL